MTHVQGVDPGGWGLDPWKYVRGVRVCFDPYDVTFFSFKTVKYKNVKMLY